MNPQKTFESKYGWVLLLIFFPIPFPFIGSISISQGLLGYVIANLFKSNDAALIAVAASSIINFLTFVILSYLNIREKGNKIRLALYILGIFMLMFYFLLIYSQYMEASWSR